MKEGQRNLSMEVISKFFWFLSYLLSVAACSSNKKTVDYIIPENFVGNIALIYRGDDKNCNERSIEYNIPNDGLLEVKCDIPEGEIVVNYIQRNRGGTYDTLVLERPGVSYDTSKNRIYFPRVLSFSKGISKEVLVSTFYVGKAKAAELEKDRFLFERRLETLILSR